MIYDIENDCPYQFMMDLTPDPKPLSEIAAQHKDRNTAIVAAYKTGAYSQREIGEFYQLHPTTIGVIARKNNDSGPLCVTPCVLDPIVFCLNPPYGRNTNLHDKVLSITLY